MRNLITRISSRVSRQSFQLARRYSSESNGYVAPPRGVNAAYDAALDYLNEFSQKKLQLAEEARKALDTATDENSKKALEAEIFQHLVDSKLYQPSTKWLFENNQCDTTEPVFMHLKKKKWTDEESFLVEQRLTQMFVLPDVLPPGVVLDAKVNVVFGEDVFPGTKVDPATTTSEPKIFIDCFHKEFKKYTIVMVDPDHPAPEIQNYREKFHWAM